MVEQNGAQSLAARLAESTMPCSPQGFTAAPDC
jgi:hypothetical protein